MAGVNGNGADPGDSEILIDGEAGSSAPNGAAEHEEDDIEAVLSHIAPLTKSVALLPASPLGTHPQMPEEGISEEEYNRRVAEIKPIDWSSYRDYEYDGQDEKYCQGDRCEIPADAKPVIAEATVT